MKAGTRGGSPTESQGGSAVEMPPPFEGRTDRRLMTGVFAEPDEVISADGDDVCMQADEDGDWISLSYGTAYRAETPERGQAVTIEVQPDADPEVVARMLTKIIAELDWAFEKWAEAETLMADFARYSSPVAS